MSTSAQHTLGSHRMPSPALGTVADVMHHGILSCKPDTAISEVARMMATRHIHCVAVMDTARGNSGEPVVWGIVSDFDLLRAADGRGAEPTAGDLAGQPIISVKPTMSLPEVVELMLNHRVSHLVVVDPKTRRPIGILSTLDVAGVLAWDEA
jgi:CBS domain-containing protein